MGSSYQAVENVQGLSVPPLATRPLSPALGLEALGVDLRQPIGQALSAQLEDAFHQGQILLIRGQDINEEEQVRFAECFGELAKTLNVHHTGKHPATMLISNIRKDGKPIGALPDGEGVDAIRHRGAERRWQHDVRQRLYGL
jgi:alpha-ketoglutarate-dependent taurine dioxygenase